MKSILIVEDNTSQRKILASYVASATSRVSEAMNGLVAYSMVLDEDFDIIISDINMPEMDGLEFFELMKQSGQLSGVSFFFSSTEIMSEEEIKSLRDEGLSGYLLKPFTKKTILELIGD